MDLTTLVLALAAAIGSCIATGPLLHCSLAINNADISQNILLEWNDVEGLLMGTTAHYPQHALAMVAQQMQLQDNPKLSATNDALLSKVFPVSASPFQHRPLAFIVQQRPVNVGIQNPAYLVKASPEDITRAISGLEKSSTLEHRVWMMNSLDNAELSQTTEANGDILGHLRDTLCNGNCELKDDSDFLMEGMVLQNAISLVRKQNPSVNRLVIQLTALSDSTKCGSTPEKAIAIQDRLLKDLKHAFRSVFGDLATVAQLSLPSDANLGIFSQTTPLSDLHKRAVLPACAASVDECQARYSNCSMHGSCTGQANPSNPSTQCFTCSCTLRKWTDDAGNLVPNYNGDVVWTGDSCQYQDISFSFQILFWFTVASIVVVIYVIALLYDIGDPSTTSTGAPTTRTKID
ncbi:hypothetical protein QVD99_000744 [Batrachochytrium dendrobatidis]|nr:hypothetical protein O5D80_003593 [Batrachochytrium dendrobatidis]KAK5673291.1 hypothetical protein QVD99_000744 [Batrachochytrium dendrobatidis]